MDGSIDRLFEKGALDQIRFCRGLCTWCTFTLVHRATKRSGLLIWARRCESVLIFGLGSLSCICIACGSFAASWISMNFMRFLEDPHMDLSSRATSRIFCILQRSDLQGKQDWFMRLVERWVLGKHWKTLEDTGRHWKPLKVHNLFTRLSSKWQTKSCRVTLSLWHLWAKVASTEYGPRLETLECYNISGNVDISRQTLVTLVTIARTYQDCSDKTIQNAEFSMLRYRELVQVPLL
jgi:hypothetical protein